LASRTDGAIEVIGARGVDQRASVGDQRGIAGHQQAADRFRAGRVPGSRVAHVLAPCAGIRQALTCRFAGALPPSKTTARRPGLTVCRLARRLRLRGWPKQA
jgi:hypothetical protein